MDNDLALPQDPTARAIAERIVSLTAERQGMTPETGGCRAFYTAEEWRDRGERYGRNAALIVVHDGGDLAGYFNMDYGCWGDIAAMTAALEGMGYYAEPCTSWYTAIYRA